MNISYLDIDYLTVSMAILIDSAGIIYKQYIIYQQQPRTRYNDFLDEI